MTRKWGGLITLVDNANEQQFETLPYYKYQAFPAEDRVKGFETPEATERRERATLNELFKLLGTNRTV